MATVVRLARWQDVADVVHALNEQADREDVPRPTYAKRLRRLAEAFADGIDPLPVAVNATPYTPGEGFEEWERRPRVSRHASRRPPVPSARTPTPT